MAVSGKKQISSDDMVTVTLLCDPCKGENEEENAVCYCTVCNEFLCGDCNKAHRRAKVSKHHKLLDRDSMPKAKLISSEENMCTKHNGKLIEYYCKLHDDCCCSECATIEHKQCKVHYIDDIVTKFEKSKEYASLMSVIAGLNQLLQTTREVALKKKNDVLEIHVKFVSEVKQFRSEINQILDSLEQSTLMEAHSIRDNDISSAEAVSTACDTMIAELEAMSSNIETQKKYKQQRLLLISLITAQNQIDWYDTTTTELNNQCTLHNYCFNPNQTLIQSIKALSSLGRIGDIKQETKKTQKSRKGFLNKLRDNGREIELDVAGARDKERAKESAKYRDRMEKERDRRETMKEIMRDYKEKGYRN